MNGVKTFVTFVKKETAFCIAGLLAVVSMFFTPPSADYFYYIDYRVLSLLFCFMAVVAGFRSVGLFEWLIKKMLCYVKNADNWSWYWYSAAFLRVCGLQMMSPC